MIQRCSCKDNSPPESQPLRRAIAFCFTCLSDFYSIFSPTDLGFLKHMCVELSIRVCIVLLSVCRGFSAGKLFGRKLNTDSSRCVL